MRPRTPGDQPHNQIGTLREQLHRATRSQGPQPDPGRIEAERLAWLLRSYPDVLLPALMGLLVRPVTVVAVKAVSLAMRRRP